MKLNLTVLIWFIFDLIMICKSYYYVEPNQNCIRKLSLKSPTKPNIKHSNQAIIQSSTFAISLYPRHHDYITHESSQNVRISSVVYPKTSNHRSQSSSTRLHLLDDFLKQNGIPLIATADA